MFLIRARQRFEAAGWTVGVGSDRAAGFFDVVAMKPGEEDRVVRREWDYTKAPNQEAVAFVTADAVHELARKCGVDLSDL